MKTANEIKEEFDAANLTNQEGNPIYSNVWSPPDADWARIYFSDTDGKGGTSYGYIWVGNTKVDTERLQGMVGANICRLVEDITNSEAQEGDAAPADIPF